MSAFLVILVAWMSLSFLLGAALVAGSWLRARRRRRNQRPLFDCVKNASCEPLDHTYSYPCDHAPGTGGLWRYPELRQR